MSVLMERGHVIEMRNRIGSEVERKAKMLEDECERLGYDGEERRMFFDLLWDYAERASVSDDRNSVRGWEL